MKLIVHYMKAPMDTPVWKIYDKETRRKLCDDYGALRGDSPLDEMIVWSMSYRTSKSGQKYVRVSVYSPIRFGRKESHHGEI